MAEFAGSSRAGALRDIMGLPREIQKEIFSHCSQCELICLSLVCKGFHELAASQLYRNFHIVFPDEDDPTFDTPIDGLAGGLDTFVTSEYNYAKHLRDLSLDTLSAGDKAEKAYKPYLFTLSCGKFMNTLLLLTLRKAKALDTFRWNIRVELSRPVYKALHDIRTLKNLHVRVQSGPSLYETPPPLPYHAVLPSPLGLVLDQPPTAYTMPPMNPTTTTSTINSNGIFGATTASFPLFSSAPPVPFANSLLAPSPQFTTYAPPSTIAPPPPPQPKPANKPRVSKKTSGAKEPPTIGGFKNLESLAVLDVDNLDIISEIQTCVRNSTSTLRKLKLSLSDSLASQARKPIVDVDPNESDDDDEFQVVHMNSNFEDGSGPAKVFRAQEERKSQESVLGRIFSIEPTPRAKLLAQKDKKRESTRQSVGDRAARFSAQIQEVSKRLAENALYLDVSKQKEILDMITQASQLYIADVERDSPSAAAAADTTTSHEPELHPDASNQGDKSASGTTEQATTEAGLFNVKPTKTQAQTEDTVPEDIDVAAPEEDLAEEPHEEAIDDVTPKNEPSPASTSIPTPTATNSTANGTPSKVSSVAPSVNATKEDGDLPDDDKAMDLLLQQTRERLDSIDLKDRTIEEIQHELNVVEAEIDEAAEVATEELMSYEELRQRMSEYTRKTRGIPLQSLSIHLIPVKASVLGRAIDFRSLTRITLLNVGNQAPIWNLMAKENKVEPLPLRKIFTDNVSLPFLQLVSQLARVDELFMLERGSKYKPESFAPRTKITLEQIRRAVLKKHMHTIQRLIIRNQADGTWDMDEKTMSLICKRGRLLEELAVVMGIRAIHAFLQYLSGLSNLRALHIISFRNDDTCLSVMRETRRFIVDTVSHYPELKLEWISMGDDNRAERIIRQSDVVKKPGSKGKGKQSTSIAGLNGDLGTADASFPILSTDSWDNGSSSEEEEEDDEGGSFPPYLKLDLIENVCFYDIWGVRIFKKEVISARL